jgi:hypothetical protein
MAGLIQRINSIGERIVKEVLEADIPNVDACHDLVEALRKESNGILDGKVLEETRIGKTLAKSIKHFKRHKRTASTDETDDWESIVNNASKLLEQWKEAVDKDAKKNAMKRPKTQSYSLEQGLPRSVAEYRMRLIVQKKEMYKDPPVMPPPTVTIEEKRCPLPRRDKNTQLLIFIADDPEVKKVLKDFQPNRTPEEVLRAGSFGGTYFRPITSAVNNISYNAQDVLKDTVDKAWIKDLPMNMLTSSTYRPQINRYGVQCGGSLGKLAFTAFYLMIYSHTNLSYDVFLPVNKVCGNLVDG